MADEDQDFEDPELLAEAVERLRATRETLSMTVYTVRRGRRTPEQVRGVIERSSAAIRRNQLVRTRWTRLLSVH